MKLPVIDDKVAIKFNDTMNEFEPMFEDFILENGDNNKSAFIAISVALRIASKLSKKYKMQKENFINTAKTVFEMDNYN